MSQSKKVLRSKSRSRSRSPANKSPSKMFKSKSEKSENYKKKQLKKIEYNKEVDELNKLTTYLLRLTERYGKVKNSSHQLVFTYKGETRTLTRAELSAAEKEREKRFLALKKKYVEGIRNSREILPPSSFKQAYAPIKVGPVFVAFFTQEFNKKLPNFGQLPKLDGDGFLPKTNLLDKLPRVKEGLLLKNSLTLLMYIYATVNNLKSKEKSEGQKNIPDDRMNYIFGDLNSLYYQDLGKPKKLMSKTENQMSTYQVVSNKNKNFNPEKIENYYFQSIQSLNYYEKNDLSDKDSKNLSNDKIKKELLQEYELIERANQNLRKLMM